MSRPAPPLRNVAMELVGFAPDRLRQRVARVRRGVETLTTDAQLDAHLARATEIFAHSDDDARHFLAGFEMAPPPMPDDPFSPRYASAQWSLYRRIARRDSYHCDHERTELDPASSALAPYPYCTGSASQVAEQLAACSYILRTLQPRRGQRIVEFGPGWGNLTLLLAMMSVDTTAVEVDSNFVDLLRTRAGANPHLRVVHSDMLSFEPDGQYDSAIFFESFHHCSDHLQMLSRLASIVRSDGAALFAAEPITAMGYPWGLRLDGLSLYCTRTFGWLELGFDNHYFDEALRRTGWRSRRTRSRSMTPLADVVVAHRMAGAAPSGQGAS